MNNEELLVHKSSPSDGMLPRKSSFQNSCELKTPEYECSLEMLN